MDSPTNTHFNADFFPGEQYGAAASFLGLEGAYYEAFGIDIVPPASFFEAVSLEDICFVNTTTSVDVRAGSLTPLSERCITTSAHSNESDEVRNSWMPAHSALEPMSRCVAPGLIFNIPEVEASDEEGQEDDDNSFAVHQEQQEEEEDEDEPEAEPRVEDSDGDSDGDSDDESDSSNDYQPATPTPLTTPATSPTSSDRRSRGWSTYEDQACIAEMTEVCKSADFCGKDERWVEVSRRLASDWGVHRSANAVKNQWNRRLRSKASGQVEDRSSSRKHSDKLVTSALPTLSPGRSRSVKLAPVTSPLYNNASSRKRRCEEDEVIARPRSKRRRAAQASKQLLEESEEGEEDEDEDEDEDEQTEKKRVERRDRQLALSLQAEENRRGGRPRRSRC